MLRNLRAEMIRSNVSATMIASTIGKTVKTTRDKINSKSDFSITDAITIRDTYFPGESIEYLFKNG